MLLAIDIGNTRVKAAVFDGDATVRLSVLEADDLRTEILGLLGSFSEISDVVVSAVGAARIDFPLPGAVVLHVIERGWPFPFENLYRTPETLGIDRMILASGAVLSYPQADRLVIDAGSCITYDFIDKDDRYHGGAISPGIRMRYRAMHEFTAKLPLLDAHFPDSSIGDSTAGSMHAGAVFGALAEIDAFIARYRGNTENFITILTGGDTDFLAGRLKNTIFANQNFLLESLNKTFRQTRNG
jgi:type III pantothenate kinase